MLMPVLEFQKEECMDKYAELARYCGLTGEASAISLQMTDEQAAEVFLQAVRELMKTCGMDRMVSPVKACDHEELIPMIAADSINYSSPVTLKNDEIKQLLREITNYGLRTTGYDEDTIREIVAAQRRFFRTGTTLPVRWRIKQLKKLKAAVIAHEEDFINALADDLGRSHVEAYLCDIGPIIVEINEMIAGLRR
jgi:hypothetical protein